MFGEGVDVIEALNADIAGVSDRDLVTASKKLRLNLAQLSQGQNPTEIADDLVEINKRIDALLAGLGDRFPALEEGTVAAVVTPEIFRG